MIEEQIKRMVNKTFRNAYTSISTEEDDGRFVIVKTFNSSSFKIKSDLVTIADLVKKITDNYMVLYKKDIHGTPNLDSQIWIYVWETSEEKQSAQQAKLTLETERLLDVKKLELDIMQQMKSISEEMLETKNEYV